MFVIKYVNEFVDVYRRNFFSKVNSTYRAVVINRRWTLSIRVIGEKPVSQTAMLLAKAGNNCSIQRKAVVAADRPTKQILCAFCATAHSLWSLLRAQDWTEPETRPNNSIATEHSPVCTVIIGSAARPYLMPTDRDRPRTFLIVLYTNLCIYNFDFSPVCPEWSNNRI